MRILLINKYHYKKGGAERAYFDMADILRAAGHEVAFFSMNHPQNEATPWSKYFVSEVDYHKRQSWREQISAARKIIWNSEANKKINDLISEFQPDIAHAHNIYHQLSPSIFHILLRRKIPIVLTLHDYKLVSPNYNLYSHGKIWDHSSGWLCLRDRCIQGSFLKSAICVLEKWVHMFFASYHLADALISPSQFLASKVVALGWKGKEIQVIPNPLREEELEERKPVQKVADRLLFFGRLSEEKGVDQILYALSTVPKKHVVLIGDGPAKEKLQSLSRELALDDRVHFLGTRFKEELTTELLKAEAVIVPSVWYENLPYVITESLALGLAVVAADSGGISERITHGKNGFLYTLGDEKALAEILKNLEKTDLEMIRENAKKSVSDLHPSMFLAKIEALYRSLL